jgi:hypothetical protein
VCVGGRLIFSIREERGGDCIGEQREERGHFISIEHIGWLEGVDERLNL